MLSRAFLCSCLAQCWIARATMPQRVCPSTMTRRTPYMWTALMMLPSTKSFTTFPDTLHERRGSPKSGLRYPLSEAGTSPEACQH